MLQRLSLLLLILSLSINPLFALDMYQGEAPVRDQSAEERSKALGKALLDVAVKVSGKPDASSNATVISAAGSPDRYMQRYEYRQELVRENGAPVAKLFLKGTFYPASVQELLRRAGYAVWGSSKPNLSVYLFEGDAPLSGEMISAMQERAGSRGINVRFPGGVAASDLSDEENLIKRLTASGQTILLGRVNQRMIITDGISSDSIDPSLDGLSDRLVPVLARRISAANNRPPADVIAEIDGIGNARGYASAMKSVMDISGVKTASLIGARNNRLLVKLSVKGGTRQLIVEANNGKTFSAVELEETGEPGAPAGTLANVLLTLK
jgi:hypothetical protein